MLIPFLAAFGLLVAALVLFPAFVPARRPTDRGTYDRAVYRRQLGELERELQYGLIHAEQAVSARTEIGRRLLAADKISPGPSARVHPRDVILAGALAALVPAGAMSLYTVLGSPSVPDQPYSARAAERAASAGRHVDLNSAVASLKAKLQQSPDNPEDWLLLARTQASLQNWEESSEAFRRALALTSNRPDVAAPTVRCSSGNPTALLRRMRSRCLKWPKLAILAMSPHATIWASLLRSPELQMWPSRPGLIF